MRRKVEDGINLVLAEHSLNLGRGSDVAMFKRKVRPVVKDTGVVQRCAIVELVERDDIVVRVGEHKMAHEPARSVYVLATSTTREISRTANGLQTSTMLSTYMNPAPPVTSMFFASGRASNFVLPVKTGAFFASSSAT